MIASEKCNCCIHEPICSFKAEYLAACEAIKKTTYPIGHGFRIMKDSTVSVSIRCPHIMTNGALRRAIENE